MARWWDSWRWRSAGGTSRSSPSALPTPCIKGWIATPAASDFILGALAACGRELSVDQLTLRHLPKGTPLDWMHRIRGGVRLATRAVRRGLVSLDDITVEASLHHDVNGRSPGVSRRSRRGLSSRP